jgi:ribose transport system substrate-binding protein
MTPSAIGCAAAVESAGLKGKVFVVGVDGSEDGKTAIREGKMLATASQKPVDIGAQAIEAAYSIIAGESVEKDIAIPGELIDASNVDASETEAGD